MSGDEPRTDAGASGGGTTRAATVRTTHADAAVVAAALAPDETDSMATRVDGDAIECAIERPTTGGLRSTADDHVVNLRVADRLVERARTHLAAGDGGRRSDTDGDTDTNTNT
ncbi:KEOPS complex subunit Pcc1 [Halorubrum yunnanense]|uniref:KEOPS complex subunit Pcc1 n=1 Tax=Halorubrum yunnanense TaxID=1526162 RepID=A0ABD5Y9W2_9EURY|nr:KEOPS complex subunit Pcc1 [Halorubrum yunnanense]